MNCPHCGEKCDQDSVDIGVGRMYGPWGCSYCGWSEYPEYDSREGVIRDPDDNTRVYDQFGVSHCAERVDGAAVLAGLNVINCGGKPQ